MKSTNNKIDEILFSMLAVYDETAHKLYCSLENDINSNHDCKVLSEDEAKHQILALIKQARIDEICTVDTDSQGKDYIRFFDGSEPCYTVTDFWNRLNQLKEDK